MEPKRSGKRSRRSRRDAGRVRPTSRSDRPSGRRRRSSASGRRSRSSSVRRPPGLRDWLIEATTHRQWNVICLNGAWLCPYCGEIGGSVDEENDEERLETIASHLKRCARFGGLASEPVFQVHELEARAQSVLFEDLLRGEKAWRIRDADDRWVCPYCVRPTDVRLVAGKVSVGRLSRIVEHVRSCSSYDAGDPMSFRPVVEVEGAVVTSEAVVEVRREVSNLMAGHEVWRVTDGAGEWICPYCRQAQADIRPRGDAWLEGALVGGISEHLVRRCRAYRNRRSPAASAEHLLASASDPSLDDPSDELSPRFGLPAVSDVMRSVRSRVDAQAAEIERDLEQARQEQLKMLPDLPTIDGYDFGAFYEPCSHLGGDFYDFIDLGEGRLGIAVGDVTGHGVKAALVMGMCKKVLNMVARRIEDPGQTLIEANREFFKDLDGRTFVTLFYGVLDTREHILRYVRAGHEPLLFVPAGGEPEACMPDGMAVGLAEGPRFEERLEVEEIALEPGDLCLLYTDGLVEAPTEDGEEFGRERLEDLVSEIRERMVSDVISLVHLEVTSSSPRGMEDDLTILGFRRI